MDKNDEVLEQPEEVVQVARANTEVNIWLQLAGAVVLSFIFHAGWYFWNNTWDNPATNIGRGGFGSFIWYLDQIWNRRGPEPFIQAYCFFIMVIMVFFKGRIVKRQVRYVIADPVQASRANMNDESDLLELRKRILEGDAATKSMLFSRVERAIGMWVSTHDVGRVSGFATADAQRDASASELSYSLSRTLMWAIPIVGFVGTVRGLSLAVNGFTQFLKQGDADLAAMKDAIAGVTAGLGVAFDTTLTALILVIIMQFPLASMMRKEEEMLSDIDLWLDEKFVSRLPSPEQQAVVIEKATKLVTSELNAMTEKYVEARRMANETEIRELNAAMEAAHARARGLVEAYSTSVEGAQAMVQDSVMKANDAAASLGQQMARIIEMGTRVDEMLKLEQSLDRSLSSIAATETFQSLLGKIQAHLDTTDAFCRKLSQPRVITLREDVLS